MALTPEKREALKLARDMIESGNALAICEALMMVGNNRPMLSVDSAELRQYIHRQLGPYLYLGKWQKGNGFGVRDPYQRRLDRLAWIDWMLDEAAPTLVDVKPEHWPKEA